MAPSDHVSRASTSARTIIESITPPSAHIASGGRLGGLLQHAEGEVLDLSWLPDLTIQAEILTLGDKTKEGALVEAVSWPWFAIVERFRRDPDAIYGYDARQWEELIAGAYERAGFDEVVLTHRSGDLGRDVIATKNGVGSIRIYGQVKAYRGDRPVPANDVRALLGTLARDQNVSKGVMTTTSTIAPGVYEEFANMMPHRIELKPRDVLLPWLVTLAKK